MINLTQWNLDNIHEGDEFLGRNKLPKVIHEELENPNKTVTRKETELVMKNLPQRKNRDRMISLARSKKH